MDSDTWLTPPEIITALGEFDLDPCCPVVMPWRTANRSYTPDDNGLLKAWHGRVWMNPPYSGETIRWMRRLVNHGDGVALIFARTETEMFFETVWNRATAVFFFQGRLSFHLPNGKRAKANAGGPSVLVAYGDDNARAIAESSLRGRLLIL